MMEKLSIDLKIWPHFLNTNSLVPVKNLENKVVFCISFSQYLDIAYLSQSVENFTDALHCRPDALCDITSTHWHLAISAQVVMHLYNALKGINYSISQMMFETYQIIFKVLQSIKYSDINSKSSNLCFWRSSSIDSLSL